MLPKVRSEVRISAAPVADAKDTVIHDPAHEARLHKIHHHLADHEQAGDNGKGQILSDILPHGQRPPRPLEAPWCL